MTYAAANARRLGFEGRVTLKEGDWANGIEERFDLILCNPPYVAEDAELGPGVREYEPDEALFAGKEGLDAYRELAPQLPRLLNAGGLAAVEIGHDQAEAVTGLLERDGLSACVVNDLGGQTTRGAAEMERLEIRLASGGYDTTSTSGPGSLP